MSFFSRIVLLGFLSLFLAGCAADGSLVNPFDDSADQQPSTPYYFSEFPDVPIPHAMSEERGNTYISFSPTGVKCGVQSFSGRLEVISLMNTMRRNMADNGWTLRALLRSKESVLVFEKAHQVCAMHITDGMIYTDMIVFMSPRLEGDSASADTTAYSQPSGSASSGGSQPLAK